MQVVFELIQCPPIGPNFPYAEVNVTMPIVTVKFGTWERNLCHGDYENLATNLPVMMMQSGPNGDLWIHKDGPNYS